MDEKRERFVDTDSQPSSRTGRYTKSEKKKKSKGKKENKGKLLWYYSKDRQIKGPVTRNQLTKMYQKGEIGDSTLVWNKKDCPEWRKIALVPDLFERVNRRRKASKEKASKAKKPKKNPPGKGRLIVGTKVTLDGYIGTAIIRYAGTVHFATGVLYGCELDNETGNNDGQMKGTRYFLCDANHGVFVRPSEVRKVLHIPEKVEGFDRGTIVETKIIAGKYKGKWVAASVHADNGDGTYNIEVLQSKKLMLTPLAVCVPRSLIRMPARGRGKVKEKKEDKITAGGDLSLP